MHRTTVKLQFPAPLPGQTLSSIHIKSISLVYDYPASSANLFLSTYAPITFFSTSSLYQSTISSSNSYNIIRWKLVFLHDSLFTLRALQWASHRCVPLFFIHKQKVEYTWSCSNNNKIFIRILLSLKYNIHAQNIMFDVEHHKRCWKYKARTFLRTHRPEAILYSK